MWNLFINLINLIYWSPILSLGNFQQFTYEKDKSLQKLYKRELDNLKR